MKPLRVQPEASAFSLIELLVVIAIIALLASVLLPVIAQGPGHARQAKCLSNLRQIGIGFQSFAHDHDSRFPMRVSVLAGGSREYVNTPQTFRHFLSLSNQLE